jgi:hypothetical protein
MSDDPEAALGVQPNPKHHETWISNDDLKILKTIVFAMKNPEVIDKMIANQNPIKEKRHTERMKSKEPEMRDWHAGLMTIGCILGFASFWFFLESVGNQPIVRYQDPRTSYCLFLLGFVCFCGGSLSYEREKCRAYAAKES